MKKSNVLLLMPLLVWLTPANAAGIKVSVAIPQIDVAEYHRPYVAVWIEREDSSIGANLAVWYQQERGKPRPAGSRRAARNRELSARAGVP